MNTDFDVAKELKRLSRDELIALIRRRGMSVTEKDIRDIRHERLCSKAHQTAMTAINEMSAAHGFENLDRWEAATRKFDRAMKLYDLADEVLCQRE